MFPCANKRAGKIMFITAIGVQIFGIFHQIEREKSGATVVCTRFHLNHRFRHADTESLRRGPIAGRQDSNVFSVQHVRHCWQ